MKYIALPTADVRRLSFYLAMEEYVARYLDEPDCLFLWQVEPSVIFGRNQVVANEVNVDYCREHGIRLMIDAAHPFAVNLHRNVVSLAEQIGVPVIRFDRI